MAQGSSDSIVGEILLGRSLYSVFCSFLCKNFHRSMVVEGVAMGVVSHHHKNKQQLGLAGGLRYLC